MNRNTHRIAITIVAALAAVAALGARADDEPIEGDFPPIFRAAPLCRPVANPEYRELMMRSAAELHGDVACGDLSGIIEKSAQLQLLARKLLGSSVTGNCFSKKNCERPKLVQGWVSKEECRTAGGESWQQENPTEGTCVNF